MKKIFICLLVTIVVTQFFVSCKKDGAVADHTQTITLPANGSSVVAANNKFAFNFLQASLQSDTSSRNKLISPLSIYIALSMVYNGANNATLDSISKVLQLSGISIDDLNATCQAFLQQLPTEDNEVQLSIANSIWYNKNSFQPLTSFIDTTQNFYKAAIEPLNFADQSSVNTINNWIAQHTGNKIQKVLSSIDPGELMYLINAIYFNGSWKSAFKTANTRNDSFHLQNGTVITTPFMNEQLIANRYVDSTMTVIELPYGGGKSYSMYIMLPAKQTVNNFASLMNENVLSGIISKMDSANIGLSLPSWEYSYSIDDMRQELSSLGMGIAFGNGADLSKMYDPAQTNAYINKAIHKTYIKVNEQGTQAAAVTVIGIVETASPNVPLFKFDQPFLYAIIEKQTGAILFVGTVTDPSQH
ncbi:MAG TPA: serpin family protein [Puia sp.]|jgi:serpin B|nr:serpin family protein [Puia sp.]